MKNIFAFLRKFRAKVTIVLAVSVLFSSALTNYLTSSYFLKAQFQQLRRALVVVTQAIALSVDGDMLERIPLNKGGRDTPEYKNITDKLSKVREIAPSLEYIYILKKTGKDGIFAFIVDVKTGRGKDDLLPAVPGDEYDASRFPALLRSSTGVASADEALSKDEWGEFLSGYAPIKNRSGAFIAILGVDMSAEHVSQIQSEVAKRAAIVFVLGIILACLIGILVSRRLTRSIESLIIGTRHVAKGDLSYVVKVVGKDEISELAESFNKMSGDLRDHIERLRITTAEKERLLRELEIAKNIQQSFLPESCPNISGFEIAAVTIPARVVGGDFYDFIPVGKDKWGIAVADVSGKGMPAALFMALSRTVLRASALGNSSSVDAVRQANRLILEDSKANLFVTLFYVLLDAQNKGVEYLNAGHNPPLLLHYSSKDIILLEAQGTPLGISKDIELATEKISLKQGDLLVIYTDGITEARNHQKEQFEIERLHKVVVDYRNESAKDIIARVEERLKDFTGDEPQFDDMTLLVVKVK